MDHPTFLRELFGRIPETVGRAVEGLTPDQLVTAPAEGANPIGWLVWHLTRVQDGHIAELAGTGEVWTEPGWAERFGLTPDPHNTGWGHTPAQVAEVQPESADALVAYLAEVHRRTDAYLGTITAADLDRVVDERWDPPVTLGVRLVSIADDDIQHAGQAGYVRGLLGA